jgi:hypothetical protein
LGPKPKAQFTFTGTSSTTRPAPSFRAASVAARVVNFKNALCRLDFFDTFKKEAISISNDLCCYISLTMTLASSPYFSNKPTTSSLS